MKKIFIPLLMMIVVPFVFYGVKPDIPISGLVVGGFCGIALGLLLNVHFSENANTDGKGARNRAGSNI